VWDGALGQHGVELWLPLEALAGGFRVAQAPLGIRVAAAGPSRPSLPEVFRQVVGTLFECLERHESYWKGRTGSEAAPLLGDPPADSDRAPAADPAPMLESFRSGVRDLAPLLGQILGPEAWPEVLALAAENAAPHYPDGLWADTVFQAAGAHRRGLMHREHVVQALVPLYLGRVASFLLESAGGDAEAAERRLPSIGRRTP
jgi:hypothetical protein